MLPILETLCNSNEREEKCNYRGYLLCQNRFLSGIISKNMQTIKQLQQILSLYDSSKSQILENEFQNKRELSEVFDSSKDYNCKLKLWEGFPVSVCKSKYFKISAQLVADEGVELIKEDRVGVSVSLFSYDYVPKRITHTMQGRSIFRGSTTSVLAFDLVEMKHLVHFKLQIREVSSHFVGGLFYLVLEPENSLETKGVFVRPLVINNLKVKAKESRGDE
jgi:hypothetical protein